MQKMSLIELESEIRAALDGVLQGAPENLSSSIRYSLFAPGKRIRPRLALASSRLLQLDSGPSVCAAVAVEMAHCFTLIHDDLPCMDDDDFRRGLPANHKVYGEAVALLAGDALLASAIEVLLAAEVEAEFRIRAARYFSETLGPRGVIGGQALELMLQQGSTLDDLRRMHRGKTGALFAAPVMIPAYLAGLSPSDDRFGALESYAYALGLSFQVADDLEDRDQDWTSVLHYQSEREAREGARGILSDATMGLESTWGGGGTDELQSIAREVLSRLQ